MSDIRRYQEEMRKIEALTAEDTDRAAVGIKRLAARVVHFDELPRPKGWWHGMAAGLMRGGSQVVPNPRRLDHVGPSGGVVCGPPCWGMLAYAVVLAIGEGG